MGLFSPTFETLRDLYLNELRDLYSAETQLLEALPKMADAASSSELKEAFTAHVTETEGHVCRLEEIFEALGEEPSGETCKAMEGLIEEGEDYVKASGDKQVRDAGLIGAAQRVAGKRTSRKRCSGSESGRKRRQKNKVQKGFEPNWTFLPCLAMPRLVSPRHASPRLACLACLVRLGIMLLVFAGLVQAENLPFNRTNPFIWNNDGEADCRALTLCLALDKLGEMNLIGISIAPHPYQDHQSENFQDIVDKARATGWQGLPDASTNLGSFYKTALSRPGSGNANDTTPIDTVSSRMIRDRVLSIGTTTKPVVIGTGGCLTTVASAYLLANQAGRGVEFASKCYVAGVWGTITE